MSFSQIIMEVTGGVDPLFTVKQIASIARVHEQTVYSWKNDATEPGYSKLMDLAEAFHEAGYHKLGFQFWPNGTRQPNGKTADETIRIIRHLGNIEDNPHNRNIVLNAAGGIEQEARNLRAEAQQL